MASKPNKPKKTTNKKPSKVPSKKPAVKKATRKKATSKKQKLSGDSSDAYHADLARLSTMFKILDPEREAREKQLRYLFGTMEEYLGSFLLLGYTIDGQPLTVTNAKTARDQDALHAALQRYIFSVYNIGPDSGPMG